MPRRYVPTGCAVAIQVDPKSDKARSQMWMDVRAIALVNWTRISTTMLYSVPNTHSTALMA